MSEIASHAEPGTITLAGVTLPVIEPVRPVNLATFPGKVTIGDHTKDSDNLLSAWIQGNFSGGVGTETQQEDVDNERFWFGTLDTRHPHQLALRVETRAYSGPVGAIQAYPLGDFQGLFHAAFDTTLHRYNVLTDAFEGNAVLAAAPSSKPVTYRGKLYVPQGAGGYDTWNGTSVVHSSAVLPVSFCLWDDKLLALETTGQLRIFDGTTWPSANPVLALTGGQTPRHLAVFVNRAGEPAVYLVTDRDLWVYDPDVPRLYPAGGVFFPPHPDHALGVTTWRGDTMYISVGVGVHNFNGSIFSTVGLDESDGLPASLRGAITDLEPEYNSLIAVVRGIAGTDGSVAEDEPFSFDATMVRDDPLYGMATQAVSSVMAWSQIGWHTLWMADNAVGNPTWARVSAADSAYRLWWGYGPDLYTQNLRRTFHTPKQGARVGADRFAETGWLETGRFDAAMRGFTKLASHFEVHLEDVLEDGSSTGTVGVQFRTDRVPSWRALGEATLPGRTTMPFGLDRDDRPEGLPETFGEGEPFGWIQFRYALSRTANVAHTPVVDSFVLKFLKLPLAGLSWQIDIPLNQPELYGPSGMGPQQAMDFLDGLTTEDRFYPLIHRTRRYRVRVAQTQGDEQSGFDQSGNRRLTLVLVPISGDAVYEEVA